MDVLLAKSPAMVRTELWSCLLAYNLLRIKMLQSGVGCDQAVRSMSLTGTLQLLSSGWVVAAVIGVTEPLARLGQSAPADEVVGHRPDRYEPRVNKRRPKVLTLMSKPRALYRLDHDSKLAA
jgi:putative transposase